jgi:glycosyltransferase involved in cell wall biosynthesis
MTKSTLERIPQVSVGMPVYNSARWIQQSVESILTQSFGDIELIISDNASTDDTFEICEDYARQDARIRLYRNPENVGANRNYLAVLRHARAPLFKWASSNDICAPTFIEKCKAMLECDRDAVLAFSKTVLFENDLADAKPYDRDVVLLSSVASERLTQLYHELGLNNVFNAVIRRQALLDAAPLGSFQRADIALIAELALMGKFLLVPEQLFFRRMSAEAATKLKSAREGDLHIEPRIRHPMKWQNWLFYSALLRMTVRHRPITADSMRALAYVLRRMNWARVHLAQDVWRAMAQSEWR